MSFSSPSRTIAYRNSNKRSPMKVAKQLAENQSEPNFDQRLTLLR